MYLGSPTLLCGWEWGQLLQGAPGHPSLGCVLVTLSQMQRGRHLVVYRCTLPSHILLDYLVLWGQCDIVLFIQRGQIPKAGASPPSPGGLLDPVNLVTFISAPAVEMLGTSLIPPPTQGFPKPLGAGHWRECGSAPRRKQMRPHSHPWGWAGRDPLTLPGQ